MIRKRKRYIKKIAKDFSSTRQMMGKLHTAELHQISQATVHDLGEDIDEAQKLHASVYLRRGFVDESDVKDGKLSQQSDPHQQHALYFIIRKNGGPDDRRVVASARQIFYSPDKGFLSFPILEKANLNLQFLKDIVGHDPGKCVEISGLTKHQDTASATVLLLYRSMWHHSLKEGHELWLMACDVRLYGRLRLLFGPAIKKIGKETPYKGGNIIPAMLNPQEALSQFLRISRRRAWMFGISRRDLVGFFVRGLPRELLSAADLKYLDSLLGKKT